jgi:hypothetical protein
LVCGLRVRPETKLLLKSELSAIGQPSVIYDSVKTK